MTDMNNFYLSEENRKLRQERKLLYDMLQLTVDHIQSGKLGTGMILAKSIDLLRHVNPDV